MYAQLIVGQEYLDLPGRSALHPPPRVLDEPAAGLDPLGRRGVLELLLRLPEHTTVLYSTHILDEAIVVVAWRAIDADRLPPLSRSLERTGGVVLLVLAGFLVAGLHLPSLLDALGDQSTRVE